MWLVDAWRDEVGNGLIEGDIFILFIQSAYYVRVNGNAATPTPF